MNSAAHRILWTVIGLLLATIGLAGILASYAVLPGIDARSPLLWSGLLRWWSSISPWGPILAVAAGVLLALLGYRLLARQLRFRPDPVMTEWTIYDGGTGGTGGTVNGLPGRTAVRAGVLARGLERDLARHGRVRRASVTLTGTPPEPEVWIRLRLGPGAPLAAVQDHVRTAVDRFTRTSGLRPRHLDITATLDPARPARVR